VSTRAQKLLEARFIDWGPALFEEGDAFLILVYTRYSVAKMGEARSCGEPHVTSPKYTNVKLFGQNRISKLAS
jgi:hypothetical protein